MVANDTNYVDAIPGLVRELERCVDHTFAAFGDLVAALPRARLEAKLPAEIGQGVFEHLRRAGEALQPIGGSVVEVRGNVVSAHRLLDKIAKVAGIEVAIGDERPKGSLDAREPAPADHLRIVA
jgi:hypothetical protein